jgi:hypothetical protein
VVYFCEQGIECCAGSIWIGMVGKFFAQLDKGGKGLIQKKKILWKLCVLAYFCQK